MYELFTWQNYTARDIFELSNDFYKFLGLADMEMCYDTPCGTEDTPENHECVANNPMIEKPDWDVVCHASAWDMYHEAKDDYRFGFRFRRPRFDCWNYPRVTRCLL